MQFEPFSGRERKAQPKREHAGEILSEAEGSLNRKSWSRRRDSTPLFMPPRKLT